MEAADSRLGSYAWKSILRGRDIIKKGEDWKWGRNQYMEATLAAKEASSKAANMFIRKF